MEESGAMVAKRVWSMVRALYFMLRKDKFNKKIIRDIKMIMKRGKLARKAFRNLMLHHQDNDTTVSSHLQYLSSNALPGEYIFSCSNTPLFRRNGSTSSHRFFSCAHATPTMEDGDEMSANIAVMKALEMLKSDHEVVSSSVLPAIGRSPVVRITDSPYHMREVDEEDNHVDEAAEEFIKKFYKDLKKQST